MSEENIKETHSKKIMRLQEEYCKKHNVPVFLLEQCARCGKNPTNYITEKKASTELVTGCHCGWSFCE
jgi:hypothetical protein